jgi:V8-like Glu-specific endopeptidase
MSLAYDLCYITTKIRTEKALSGTQIEIANATGFFITFITPVGEKLCLVTNRHVIEGKDKMSVYLNKKDAGGNPIDDEIVIGNIDLSRFKEGADYYFHPRVNRATGEPYDLCVIPFENIIPSLEKQTGSLLYYKSFKENDFMTNTNKSTLDSIEDIIMVGYPNGIWDEVNNRPIIRKGITATDPKVDYMNSQMFLIDCACIQGSSGSPVLQYKDGLKAKVENGKLNLSDSINHMLLGIQQSIPIRKIEATIDSSSGTTNTLQTGERISVEIPINLGFILKAELLLEFKNLIKWS